MIPRIYIFYFYVFSMALDYFPTFYFSANRRSFSVHLWSVDIYLSDICFLITLAYFLFYHLDKLLRRKIYGYDKKIFHGYEIVLTIVIFFILTKYIIQNQVDTATIRTLINFSFGYIFLLFLPALVQDKKDFRKSVIALLLFSLYIFALHIYSYIVYGYKLHILSGNFITTLGIVFFLMVTSSSILKINKFLAYLISLIILLTYLMVGHRSSFIALMLSLLVMVYLERKYFLKVLFLLAFLAILGGSAFLFMDSDLASNIIRRAETTFDTKQMTYQGRYQNIFIILNSAKENPVLGIPLGSKPTRYFEMMKIKTGSIIQNTIVECIVPHNLILEWIYFYGIIGLCIGIVMIWTSFIFCRICLMQYRQDPEVLFLIKALFCTWIHNLIFGLCNVTTMSIFTVFFLYFPLSLIVALSRLQGNSN